MNCSHGCKCLGWAIISTLKRALQPLWNRCRAWKASKKLSFFWWIQIIPKEEPQTEQGFDNNANIPKTQPDLQQEEATDSPYSIMEPRDIHHTDNEVLQLTLLSNDDDEFYLGCILDPRVTGWSEWIIFPKTHLNEIKLCFSTARCKIVELLLGSALSLSMVIGF